MNTELAETRAAAVQARAGRNMSELERWASIAAGTGLALYGLSRRKPLGWGLAALGGLLVRRGASGHCHTYALLGISTAGGADTKQALGGKRGTIVEERVIVNRPRAELYRFWRNIENLPRVLTHVESVERLTETLSRWRAQGPAGTSVEWTAEIINDVPDDLIAWRSIEHSEVVSAGSVHFEDAGRGRTLLRIRLQYSPPGGKVGAALARLMGGDAATAIREDLVRFKSLIESGDVRQI